MNIEWNADDYQKNFSFVPQYGESVLGLITEPHTGLAVDLGCGNGNLTPKLAEMGYQVLGIDASDAMLALAKEQHPSLTFRKGNAVDFVLEEKADVIFSNAVLHWIDGELQEKLLKNIADQLKPGGQFVCEFGGAGCAEHVHSTLEQIFDQHGLTYRRVFYFPSIGMYAPLLEKAGFRLEYAVLFDRPTAQKGEDGLADWIRMFVKEPFRGIEPVMADEIIREAIRCLKPQLFQNGVWYVDYVRIRFRAVKEV